MTLELKSDMIVKKFFLSHVLQAVKWQQNRVVSSPDFLFLFFIIFCITQKFFWSFYVNWVVQVTLFVKA